METVEKIVRYNEQTYKIYFAQEPESVRMYMQNDWYYYIYVPTVVTKGIFRKRQVPDWLKIDTGFCTKPSDIEKACKQALKQHFNHKEALERSAQAQVAYRKKLLEWDGIIRDL